MAENYREQNQEEAEGIVDAGGFTNDPGTGMIAEDQETASAADSYAEAAPYAPVHDDEEAIEETEASENAPVDLHENAGSGIDVAVIVIILLVIIGCISFGIANGPKEPDPQTTLQQQLAAQGDAPAGPPYEVAELGEGVAAVVNGEVIEESTIDEYVAGFRKLYGLENDDDWAGWMVSYDYTPENVRDLAISSYVDEAIVKQAVEEYGIQASQAAIDEKYNAARENFATEEEWQEGLEQASLTEETFLEQCKFEAEQEALMDYLGDRWFATPEDEEAEMLVAVKQYYPQYADVESLDGISEEELEPVHEMVVHYARQDAFSKFMADARENGDIKMSAAPADLPYEANMLIGFFQNMFAQLTMAQELSQMQQQQQ